MDPNNYGYYYPHNNECPTLYIFLIKNATPILEKLGDPNWVIAIFTVLLALGTAFLWKATRDLVRGAERASEYQLRAYVYPSVKGIKKFSLTEPIEISITLKNAGQTPALECEASGSIGVCALPLDDDAQMSDPTEPDDFFRHSKQSIYPQGEVNFDCVSVDLLNDGFIEELRRYTAAIYVTGEIRYKDMFGHERSSEFCFYIQPDHTVLLIDDKKGKTVVLPPEIKFVTAHVWNRAT